MRDKRLLVRAARVLPEPARLGQLEFGFVKNRPYWQRLGPFLAVDLIGDPKTRTAASVLGPSTVAVRLAAASHHAGDGTGPKITELGNVSRQASPAGIGTMTTSFIIRCR